MAIEFSCSGCGMRIKTPDASAGRQGKCPKCGTPVHIPASTAPLPGDGPRINVGCPSCGSSLTVPQAALGKKGKCPRCQNVVQLPATDPSASTGVADGPFAVGDPLGPPTGHEDLFADLPPDAMHTPGPPQGFGAPSPALGSAMPTGGPTADSPMNNPYASPQYAKPTTTRIGAAKSKVMGPSISLIVIAGLSTLLYTGSAVLQLVTGKLANEDFAFQLGSTISAFLIPLMHLIVLVGAISMLRLKSYGSAMTGAVLSVIPICSPLCIVGIPFGIWALVVLNSEEVKRAFR